MLKIQFEDLTEEQFVDGVLVSSSQPGKQLVGMEVALEEGAVVTDVLEVVLVAAKTAATNAETEDISHAIADVEDVAGNFHRLIVFSRGNKHRTGCCVTKHSP